MKNNSLNQAKNQVESGYISVQNKEAAFLPEVDAGLSSTDQYTKDRDVRSVDADITASINLFNGFRDKAGLLRTRFELEAEKATCERTGQQVIFDTVSQFMQIVIDKEFIGVEGEYLEANKKQLADIKASFKAGSRPVGDVYKQEAETRQAELNLLDARRNLDTDKLTLLQVIGLRPSTGYAITSPDIYHLGSEVHRIFSKEILNGESLVAGALDKRMDIESRKHQMNAYEQSIREAKAGLLPTVSLFAKAGSGYTDSDNGSFYDQFAEDNWSTSAGLSVSVPVFDRMQTRHDVAQAEIQYRNARLDLEDLEYQVTTDVRQALLSYETSVKKTEVARAQLKSARQALDADEARYRVGAGTLVELTDTRSLYLDASYERIKAEYEMIIAALSVAFHQGDIEKMLLLAGLDKKKFYRSES